MVAHLRGAGDVAHRRLGGSAGGALGLALFCAAVGGNPQGRLRLAIRARRCRSARISTPGRRGSSWCSPGALAALLLLAGRSSCCVAPDDSGARGLALTAFVGTIITFLLMAATVFFLFYAEDLIQNPRRAGQVVVLGLFLSFAAWLLTEMVFLLALCLIGRYLGDTYPSKAVTVFWVVFLLLLVIGVGGVAYLGWSDPSGDFVDSSALPWSAPSYSKLIRTSPNAAAELRKATLNFLYLGIYAEAAAAVLLLIYLNLLGGTRESVWRRLPAKTK